MTQYRWFSPASFASALQKIENYVFEFAAQSYGYLQYGNALTDIWTEYRTQVDARLHSLGFGTHLDTIQKGIRSDNPEDWRSAMFACRSLLTDIASYLWRDSRSTYEHIKNPKGQPISVTPDKFSNRLSAYIHQKGVGGTRGKFFRTEFDKLGEMIRALVAFQSEAHAPVSRSDARSVAITTYIVLGELVARTDMLPVETYATPSVPDELE